MYILKMKLHILLGGIFNNLTRKLIVMFLHEPIWFIYRCNAYLLIRLLKAIANIFPSLFSGRVLLSILEDLVKMRVCGPKFSLCGVIISTWGIIQLASMGIFYHFKSVALLEDLPMEENFETPQEFYVAADAGYSMNAMNCWIAACLYVFTLAFSSYQFYVNSRTHV